MNQTRYYELIKRLRKERKLHDFVEERIIKILNHITPELHCFKEIHGLRGGRNDLLAVEYNGRKVLFELFASQSQVSRDLRILDKTEADVKIAIIIDKEVDEKVFNRFYRENTDDYPFLFINELFIKENLPKSTLKLIKLIRSEDETLFKTILNQQYSFEKFKELCESEGLELIDPDNYKNEEITFERLFNYFILVKIYNLTNSHSSLKKIVSWLGKNEVFKYAIFQLQHGFNLFLYTDLNENFALYNDIDLLDWLRIGPKVDSPYILLSINSIVNSILKLRKDNTEKFEVNFMLGDSFFKKTEKGSQVFLSIPYNTNEIVITKPWKVQDATKKVLTEEEILKMIKIM